MFHDDVILLGFFAIVFKKFKQRASITLALCTANDITVNLHCSSTLFKNLVEKLLYSIRSGSAQLFTLSYMSESCFYFTVLTCVMWLVESSFNFLRNPALNLQRMSIFLVIFCILHFTHFLCRPSFSISMWEAPRIRTRYGNSQFPTPFVLVKKFLVVYTSLHYFNSGTVVYILGQLFIFNGLTSIRA